MSLHITNPLIMPFNVQEMPFSYTNFQKNLPTVGGGDTPLPLPRVAPSHITAPLRLNPGYATEH